MARSDSLVEKAKKKAKKAAAYVNDNLNPLTSKKTKAAVGSYMNKAKTQSLAGRVTNTDTRMARLGDPGSKKRGK